MHFGLFFFYVPRMFHVEHFFCTVLNVFYFFCTFVTVFLSFMYVFIYTSTINKQFQTI